MDARQSLNNKSIDDLPVALREGEAVLARAIISTGIYWKAFAILCVAILLLLLAYQLAIFMSLVSLVAFGYAYLIRHALLMIVTNQRVMVRAGILKVDTVQIRLDRIESVEIQRTIPGQFLNFATVMMSGTGTTLAFIPYVSNAQQVRDVVDELLYKREKAPQHVIVDEVAG